MAQWCGPLDPKTMTAGANSLTARATAEGPPSPAFQFRAFVDAFERLGYDGDALLQQLDLRRADLDDPDGVVSCGKSTDLFVLALRQKPLTNIGMRLAAETPIGASGLLDYLILTAPTVGEGLTEGERYFRTLTGAPFGFEVRDEGDCIRVVFHGGGGARQGMEYTIARMVFHFRSETSQRAVFQSVHLMLPPDDAAGMTRAFGCEVQIGSSWNGITMPRSTFELPLRRGDSRLHRLLQAQAPARTDATSAAEALVAGVRRAITASLRNGVPDVETVARHLGVSARTLQRRLADAGESFNRVLDATRQEAARRWLTESELAIGEIAYLLGYADPAAFHRAFKRWTGATPQSFRLGSR